MTERAQLEHALIDVDILHKPKAKAMMQKFGKLAGLAYLELIFQLSRATNAEVEVDTALCVANDFNIPNPEEWLEYLLHPDRQMVEKTKKGRITQERVAHDQEALAASRRKWKEQKKHQREHPKDSPRESTMDTPTDTPGFRERVNSEDLNTEDLKNEILRKIANQKFPSAIDRPECRDALARWIFYLKTRHEQDLDIQSVEALLMSYGNRAADFVRDVLYTVQSGRWKSIVPKPPDPQPKSTTYSKPPDAPRPRSKDCKQVFAEQGISVTPKTVTQLVETVAKARSMP
jgi:hypothetical protein